MNRTIAISVLAVLGVIAAYTMGNVGSSYIQATMLACPSSPWEVLGTITASQSYPAVGDRDYTTVAALPDANTVTWEVAANARQAMLSFETTADADSTTVVLLGFADIKQVAEDKSRLLDDDAVYLGQLVLTGGTQVGSHSNVCVDTIVRTDAVGTFSVLDSAADRRAVVTFNTLGFKRIVAIATTLEGSSTLYVQGRYF